MAERETFRARDGNIYPVGPGGYIPRNARKLNRQPKPKPSGRVITRVTKLRKPQEGEEDAETTRQQFSFLLDKPMANLPSQSEIMLSEKRGNGKIIVGSKGRIRVRRRLKASKRNKAGVLHA